MKLFSDLLSSSNLKNLRNNGPMINQRRGVEIKSSREVAIMRKSSHIVATVLTEINQMVEPGMTTGYLDEYAERRIREMGAVPSFKGYHGFPASICASINNEVVHGIPSSQRVLKLGDLVKIDTGAYFDGYHGDSCITIALGDVVEPGKKLSRIAQEALMVGLKQMSLSSKFYEMLMLIMFSSKDNVQSNAVTSA